MFQSNTTNGNTLVGVVPNGTASSAGWYAFSGSDTNNVAYAVGSGPVAVFLTLLDTYLLFTVTANYFHRVHNTTPLNSVPGLLSLVEGG